jgi:hypothetical protein
MVICKPHQRKAKPINMHDLDSDIIRTADTLIELDITSAISNNNTLCLTAYVFPTLFEDTGILLSALDSLRMTTGEEPN